MKKITIKTGRRPLSVPARVIKRAVHEVYHMPDSEFDFENPEPVIVTRRMPTKKKAVKKAVSKTTISKKAATKKPKTKKSARK